MVKVKNSFKTLGEAWIFGLRQVMEHGEEMQDKAVVARDISLDLERSALLLSEYESPLDETKLDLKLKEILGHVLYIETVSIDDPVIAKYADQQRIDYTRKRYGKNSGPGGYGEFIYGPDSATFDSIVDRLSSNPSSKSTTVNAPNVSTANCGKPPCLSAVDFKIRGDRLLMTVMYRSQNIFTKQPGNILALRDLQNTIADRVGVAVGGINLFAASAHIYEPDWKAAEAILAKS
ncbi:MAG TPA: thymidylate synthase [Candidatus Saccharimonadales bacterium]|nr:thymidylate synthase [Candidatus Saccharimonadales bacterium]